MARRTRQLEFSEGFVGSPTPPDQTGSGCPNWQNARHVGLSKESVESWPGFRRTLLEDLWDGTRADEIQIKAMSPKVAGRDDGRVIAAVDGINGRILYVNHFPGGIPWLETNGVPDSPLSLGTMRRHSNNDYLSGAILRNRLTLTVPFDEPRVYDGQKFRLAGISKPAIAPLVEVDGSAETTLDAGTTNWTAVPSTVTPTTETDSPQFNGGYVQLVIDKSVVAGNLAFRDSSTTIGATSNRMRVRLRNDNVTGEIPKNKLKLVLADAVSLGGTTQEMFIDKPLPPEVWVTVDVPWPGTGSSFSMASLGLKLESGLEDDLFDSVDKLTLRVDSIGHSVSTANGTLNGSVAVAVSFYDSKRDRESDVSPFSEVIELGTGVNMGVKLDLSGFYPGIEGGQLDIGTPVVVGTGNGTATGFKVLCDSADESWVLTALGNGPTASFSVVGSVSGTQSTNATSATAYDNGTVAFTITDGGVAWVTGDTVTVAITGGVFLSNCNPDSANVDKFRLYIHKTAHGNDEFGRPIFRRAIEEVIPLVEDNGVMTFTFLDQKTEDELIASPQFLYDKGKPQGTQFVSVDKERLVFGGQPDYSVGECGVTAGSHLVDLVTGADEVSKVVPGSNTGNGGVSALSATTAAVSETWVLTANSVGPTATFDVVGSVSGAATDATSETAYTNTQIAFTIEDGGVPYAIGDTFTFLVTSADDNTANWGPWAEGRIFRLGSDEELYTVIKVLDQDNDGTFDTLWVGRGLGFVIPYEGSTNTSATYGILGSKNIVFYTSKTATRGAAIEQVPILNQLKIEMPGDSINGLGHMGKTLIVGGLSSMFQVLQNNVAIDDDISSPSPFPRASQVKGAPGVIAGRTIVSLPGNQLAYLSAEGRIAVGSPRGFSFHPLSERLRGWITDDGKIAQERLQFAHAFFHKELNWYCVCLQESITSSGISTPIAELQEVATENPTLLSSTGTEGQYDFAFPWTDNTGRPTNPPFDHLGIPNVDFAPFSPRIAGADMTAPSTVTSTDALTGVEIISEGWGSDAGSIGTGAPNVGKVIGGWVLNAPIPLPEQKGSNGRHTSTWHTTYRFGRAADGFFHMKFTESDMPSVSPTPVFDPQGSRNWFARFDGGPNISSEAILTSSFIQDDAVAVYFQVFFDAPTDRVIPANTFRIVSSRPAVSQVIADVTMFITQPIRGGQWNLIRLEVPAPDIVLRSLGSETDSIYGNDLDGTSHDGLTVSDPRIFLHKAIASGVFDASNEINLYFSGGRQVFTGLNSTVTPVEVTSEDAVPPACKSFGDDRDSGDIHVDFDRMAVIDLTLNTAYIGRGFNLTCTSGVSADCAAIDKLPDIVLAGDTLGYTNKVFANDAFGLGVPQKQNRWTVEGGSTTTVILVDISSGAIVNGTAPLVGLTLRLERSDNTAETGTITSSGADFIEVTSATAFATAPAAGDVVVVSPMTCFVQFREQRFINPASLHGLWPNIQHTSASVPKVDIDVFGGSDDAEVFASEDNTLASRALISLSEAKDGKGLLEVPSAESKALMHRVSWIKPDQGLFRLGPITALEHVAPGEPGVGPDGG